MEKGHHLSWGTGDGVTSVQGVGGSVGRGTNKSRARRVGSGQNFVLQIIYSCSPFLRSLRSGVSSLEEPSGFVFPLGIFSRKKPHDS